VGSR
jgi:hypothetical protein